VDMAYPRTAVIGAGISGLTAGKMLKDYGVPYTTFETSDRIGGNWAFGNPNGHSSAYRSLHIDTSRDTLSFKDFPMPAHYPEFPHHADVKTYLDDYAATFGLLDNIEFTNGVISARRANGGGWDIVDQAGDSRHFELLVVANGHHWDPRYPNFPGAFSGTTIHSHHYVDPRTPLELTGKRILIVGLGNSAADITVELSSKALQNTVTLSTRSSAWIVPKYIAGRPGDTLWRTSPYLPLSWQRKAIQLLAPVMGINPTLYGLPAPNHKLFEAHPTQSVELPLRLGSGDVIPKPNVARLDGDTVHFEDGTSDEFDVIIYSTGYNITFPFFEPGFISAPDNGIRLFKRMFVPGVEDLAFIGFAQSVPTLFPFVECQSRCLAAYAIGRYALPSVGEMERVIDADQELYTGHCTTSARHTQQVDFFHYEHDMRVRELPAGRKRAAARSPVHS
jgi:cation diffusion facilitator CzcD-associated flavoprotein CzcO